MNYMKLLLTVLISVASILVHADVRSYTLGIDVNCPSGLGE
jgi:hypothetical protein